MTKLRNDEPHDNNPVCWRELLTAEYALGAAIMGLIANNSRFEAEALEQTANAVCTSGLPLAGIEFVAFFQFTRTPFQESHI